jgi:LysM repeat protein
MYLRGGLGKQRWQAGFVLVTALVSSLLTPITPARASVHTFPSAPVFDPSQPQPGTHVVQPGENLFRIGLRYGLTVTQLMMANGLTNPDQIYAGQILIIPFGNATTTLPQTGSALGTGGTTHTVQPGETLSGIAQQYGVSMAALATVNGINNPSRIYVGQVLSIPGRGGNASPVSNASGTAGRSTTYTVQRGDTLLRIATRYNVTVSALMAANQLANADRIYVGQSLIIPAGSGTATGGPAYTANAPIPTVRQGKQIIVVLSQQQVFAYENGILVRQFVVSTGLPGTPTVTGNFTIYAKYPSQYMVGPDYNLPNVPWVMYFYRGYSFHGTYWHNNFGRPMSHGCINMRTAEAEWLYNWAPIGTPVLVIY